MSDTPEQPVAGFTVEFGGVVEYKKKIPEVEYDGAANPARISVLKVGSYDLDFTAIGDASFKPENIEWETPTHPGVELVQTADPTKSFKLLANYSGPGIPTSQFKILMGGGGPANDPSIAIDPPGLNPEE